MEHSTELPKSFANRIARAAFSEDAANITRLLLLSGYLGGLLGSASDQPSGDCTNDQSQEGDLPPVMTNAKQVGIWECREEGGKTCFVRRKDLFKEWHLWADIERIEPKGGKQRVVLIGESVARGFIYDPAFNPAIALEAILQSRLGENEVEVIDLARTNIGYEVGELAASALLLDPDLVVIFAGNNWGISFPEPAEVVSMDAILRAQGIAGVKLLAEAQIERNARNVVNTIAGILGSRNVPLVWVIPEFNLGDWREPLTTAPYLLDNLNREWTAAYGEAQNALNRGDLGRASELAKRMVEIDGGVCAAGFYILAECSRQRRESKALRHYLELARDAVIWDSSRLTVPRSLALVQEILRNEAGNHKTQIVDLPKLFEEHLQGGIPGRQLFLDYCHLTSEGIQIAMSAVASCALQLLKEMRVPWNALAGECILPIGEIEAEASFLAAIHNAHWSQPYEPIHYHCLRSLHLSPHIGPLMINYIELQTQRTAPLLMC